MSARQLSLLGAPAETDCRLDPGFQRARRLHLGQGAWIEHVPGWLTGADHLFEVVRTRTEWVSHQRIMYERLVEVPRLLARPERPPHPVLAEAMGLLSSRYERRLDQLSLALYRDGRDSVAWHGDRVGRELRETVVAIVSLGEPRKFLLRPGPGAARLTRSSMSFVLMGGDLLVMGGTCQTTWEHCVPKVASAGPRIAVMYRELAV